MSSHYSPSDPSLTFVIGPLQIRVRGRCYPWIEDPFDYDWLGATCLYAGRIQSYETLEASELALLRSTLNDLLQTSAPLSFVSIHQVFHLEIKHLAGENFSVKLVHISEESERFMATKGELETWVTSLSTILLAYPPRRELEQQR